MERIARFGAWLGKNVDGFIALLLAVGIGVVGLLDESIGKRPQRTDDRVRDPPRAGAADHGHPARPLAAGAGRDGDQGELHQHRGASRPAGAAGGGGRRGRESAAGPVGRARAQRRRGDRQGARRGPRGDRPLDLQGRHGHLLPRGDAARVRRGGPEGAARAADAPGDPRPGQRAGLRGLRPLPAVDVAGAGRHGTRSGRPIAPARSPTPPSWRAAGTTSGSACWRSTSGCRPR